MKLIDPSKDLQEEDIIDLDVEDFPTEEELSEESVEVVVSEETEDLFTEETFDESSGEAVDALSEEFVEVISEEITDADLEDWAYDTEEDAEPYEDEVRLADVPEELEWLDEPVDETITYEDADVDLDDAGSDIIVVDAEDIYSDLGGDNLDDEYEVESDDALEYLEMDEEKKSSDWLSKGMIFAAAAIVLLCVVMGGVLLSGKLFSKDVTTSGANGVVIGQTEDGSTLAEDELPMVGAALADIELVGADGLERAYQERLAKAQEKELVAAMEAEEAAKQESHFTEADYVTSMEITTEAISVMKDLKIKFINKSTKKLIANVPFTLTVTGPDGKKQTWTDDDQDGVIYHKKISGGDYKIHFEPLSGEQYADIKIPSDTTVKVKEEIAYKKVEVADEVKKASEVNEAKEDTGRGGADTGEGPTFKDTVAYVDSSTGSGQYVEISKDDIVSPLAIAKLGTFVRLAQVTDSALLPGNQEVGTTDGQDNQQGATDTSDVTGNVVDGTTNTSDTTGPISDGTVIPGENAISSEVSVESGQSSNNQTFGTNQTIGTNQETGTGQAAGDGQQDATGGESGTNSGSVEGNSAGDVQTNAGQTAGTDGGENTTGNVSSDEFSVTISADSVKTYVGSESKLTVESTKSKVEWVASSGNEEVATVTLTDGKLSIVGVSAGSTTIAVTAIAKDGSTASSSCAVAVVSDPQDDTMTVLKDKDGNTVYVLENDAYRVAKYADYYTATAFFIAGDIKYTGWQVMDGNTYYYNADGVKVTGDQIIQGMKYSFDSSTGALKAGSGIKGVDVSKWNGAIDWNAVANAGVKFAIIRVGYRGSSQGALIDDATFATNMKGAAAAGLKVGVYFYTQAIDEVEALYEASMVLDRIAGYRISYPIFLDVESSGGRADAIDTATRTAVCNTFLETIRGSGYSAGIYANKTWFTEKINTGSLKNAVIWLAQYASEVSYGGHYDIWQYSEKGSVTGIKGKVDMNLSYMGY